MDVSIERSLPDGVVAVRCWRHAGIDCAVADVHGALSGLARTGHRRSGWSRVTAVDALPPERLGQWVLLRPAPAGRYWSVEDLARFVSPSSAELAAWGSGEVWAVERVCRIVNGFVDHVVGR